MNREEWLHSAAEIFKEKLFAPIDVKLPKNIRIGVGFPKGRGGKGQHAIGQCWTHEKSKDGTFEIFIHPELDNPYRVADVLIHELCHVGAGIDAGHGSKFRRIAVEVGLAGKMTATVAGEELFKRLPELLQPLPKYPHASLDWSRVLTTAAKKDGTRMIKATCSNESCGFVIRTTRKWIENVGLPICACGGEFECE